MAAMVANERAAEAMLDEPGVAILAAEAMTAGAAQGQRRIAAPVQEQAASVRRCAIVSPIASARRGAIQRPRSAAFDAHVDRFEPRHETRIGAGGEPQMPVATARGVDARFDRRRCGGEHDACVFKSCAHHRHVARVVGNAVLLLVGGLMFLIDDDEAEIAEGQEQRRARAGDNLHFARRRAAPDARPLSRRHARMPFGGLGAKARGEALEKLRGERDFRHEHERLSAALQSARDRFEIDFRLAGAGDAFEQEWAKGVLRNGARQFIRGGLLFGFESRRIEQGVERRRDRLRRRGDSRRAFPRRPGRQ